MPVWLWQSFNLIEIMSRDKVDPDEMIYHMNNDLFLTKTGGMFVTAILGYYNTITDEISWVNGGINQLYLETKMEISSK